jgi:hypothetical protein
MMLTRFAFACGLLAATSCLKSPTDAVCRDPSRLEPPPAGIQVIAFDSVTMNNATAGAKIVARQSATVADSVNSAGVGSAWVGQVVGNYTVTVTKAGYQPWSRANVDVDSDVCGFIPVQLTALLQPQ